MVDKLLTHQGVEAYLKEVEKSDKLLVDRTRVAVNKVRFPITESQFDAFADRIEMTGDRIGASQLGRMDALRVLGRRYSSENQKAAIKKRQMNRG